jgi:hypothetical protein
MVKKQLHLTQEDRDEIKREIKRNAEQRLDFVRQYADWLKKTPNKVWSKQHAKYLGEK